MLKVFKVKENKVACWINPRDFGAHEKSLIFIHGSGSNSGVWSHQYARLHKKYNIAAINLPGHGNRQAPESVMFMIMCADYETFCKAWVLPNPLWSAIPSGRPFRFVMLRSIPQTSAASFPSEVD